jgi:hypothetical protein
MNVYIVVFNRWTLISWLLKNNNDINMDKVDVTDQVPDAWYTIVGKTLLWYGRHIHAIMVFYCNVGKQQSQNPSRGNGTQVTSSFPNW